MKFLLFPASRAFILAASFISMASIPTHASDSSGWHIVQRGETLFCIGRAYGLHPGAIADTNGVGNDGTIYAGQPLALPDVRWQEVPPGPVCRRQGGYPSERRFVVPRLSGSWVRAQVDQTEYMLRCRQLRRPTPC